MNKDIKLIAVDLDGTLLNSDHNVSDYTVRIWKEVQKRGIHIMPVTGRTVTGMRFSVPYELCEYSINTNGVHIFKNNNGEPKKLWDKSIQWDVAFSILEFLTRQFPSITVQAYSDEELYALAHDARTGEYLSRAGIPYNILKSWDEIEGKDISKIMSLDTHLELLPVAQAMLDFSEVHAVFSMPIYLETFSVLASKGHALEYVMELLGIPHAQVLGIGDSFNDLAMLEVCGTSYVMRNANPKVAPHLPRTEYTNNEHGVAKLIEQLIL